MGKIWSYPLGFRLGCRGGTVVEIVILCHGAEHGTQAFWSCWVNALPLSSSLALKNSKFYINVSPMDDTKISLLYRRGWPPCPALFEGIDIDLQSDKNCQR